MKKDIFVRVYLLCSLCVLTYYRGPNGYECCLKQKKEYFARLHPVTMDPWLEGLMKNKLFLSPFIPFRELFLIAANYSLGTCIIEKVMSTFRNGLFCFLNKPWLFGNGKKHLSSVRWGDAMCDNGTSYRRTSVRKTLRSLGHDPVIFLVVRDPFQRFISGFTNKCMVYVTLQKIYWQPRKDGDSYRAIIDRILISFISRRRNNGGCCFYCNRDMLCFLLKLRKLLFSYQEDPKKSFSEGDQFSAIHFAPLTWYCHSIEFLKSMHIIRQDMRRRKQMAWEYDYVLQIAGVPMRQRSYIRFEMTRRLPIHSTWSTSYRVDAENQLLSNRTLFEIFLQLYYHDFRVFGYKIPKPQYIL